MKLFYNSAAAVVIICALLVPACFSMGERPASVLAPDKPAGNIRLFDLSGKIVRLSDYKGKVVFLNFFATWCPPCRNEMPSMEKLHRLLKGGDFAMLAVALDRNGDDKVRSFIKNGGYTFTVLLDGDNLAADIYGIRSIPTTYIIDKKGNVAHKAVGGRDWNSPEVINLLRELINK